MPCHCFLRVGVIAAPRLAYPNPLTAESHLVSRTTRSTGSPLVPTGLPQLVRRPSILGLLSPVASSLGVTHDVKTAKERGLGARATARRDVLCPCGSGRRFQHCCVQPGRSPKPADCIVRLDHGTGAGRLPEILHNYGVVLGARMLGRSTGLTAAKPVIKIPTAINVSPRLHARRIFASRAQVSVHIRFQFILRAKESAGDHRSVQSCLSGGR